MGRDDDQSLEDELRELFDDSAADFGDVLAAIVQRFPDRAPEISRTMREIGEDARGVAAWAWDKRDMRRCGRDALRRSPAGPATAAKWTRSIAVATTITAWRARTSVLNRIATGPWIVATAAARWIWPTMAARHSTGSLGSSRARHGS